MIKRDYHLEEVESGWDRIPTWLKIKIGILITWYTWESQLAEWWLLVTTSNL